MVENLHPRIGLVDDSPSKLSQLRLGDAQTSLPTSDGSLTRAFGHPIHILSRFSFRSALKRRVLRTYLRVLRFLPALSDGVSSEVIR